MNYIHIVVAAFALFAVVSLVMAFRWHRADTKRFLENSERELHVIRETNEAMGKIRLTLAYVRRERDRARAAALEQETRAKNAEHALERLQDEVVTLRHVVAGSVPVAELRAALTLSAAERWPGSSASTLPEFARVLALIATAEQRGAAATPSTEAGVQADLVAGEFVTRETGGNV